MTARQCGNAELHTLCVAVGVVGGGGGGDGGGGHEQLPTSIFVLVCVRVCQGGKGGGNG